MIDDLLDAESEMIKDLMDGWRIRDIAKKHLVSESKVYGVLRSLSNADQERADRMRTKSMESGKN